MITANVINITKTSAWSIRKNRIAWNEWIWVFVFQKLMSNFVDLCLNISSSINLQFLTGDWRPWIFILLPKNFLMRLKGKREEDHHSTDSISFFRSMSMSQIKSILVIYVFCCMLYVFRFHEKFFLFIKQTISLDPLNLFYFSTFFQSQTIFH